MTRLDEERGMFMPYCEADFKYAVGILEDAGIEESLFDLISKWCEQVDMRMYDVDPCGVAMETVFQKAREDIQEFCDIDICDLEIYVHANYNDTSIQFSDEAVEALEQAINEAYTNDPDYAFEKSTILLLDEMGISF